MHTAKRLKHAQFVNNVPVRFYENPKITHIGFPPMKYRNIPHNIHITNKCMWKTMRKEFVIKRYIIGFMMTCLRFHGERMDVKRKNISELIAIHEKIIAERIKCL